MWIWGTGPSATDPFEFARVLHLLDGVLVPQRRPRVQTVFNIADGHAFATDRGVVLVQLLLGHSKNIFTCVCRPVVAPLRETRECGPDSICGRQGSVQGIKGWGSTDGERVVCEEHFRQVLLLPPCFVVLVRPHNVLDEHVCGPDIIKVFLVRILHLVADVLHLVVQLRQGLAQREALAELAEQRHVVELLGLRQLKDVGRQEVGENGRLVVVRPGELDQLPPNHGHQRVRSCRGPEPLNTSTPAP